MPTAGELKLPGKEAKAEDWKAFYKAIGAPESGDAYALPVPEGGNPEFAKEAAAMMAEAGLLPQQAKALAEWWNSKSGAALQASQAAAAQAEADAGKAAEADDVALHAEWKGDAYDKNIEAAKKAVRQFVPEAKRADILDGLQKVMGYGDTMRFMANIGAKLAEGSANGLDGGQGNSTPKSIEQRLYGTK